MLETKDTCKENKLDEKVYTFDVNIDYTGNGQHVVYEQIILDRSWFKLDRKPFEPKYPQSLPDFLYRYELCQPYTFENLEAAIKNGAKLKAMSKFPGALNISDKSYLFRTIARHQRSRQAKLFEYIPITFSYDVHEVQFYRDVQKFCRVFLAIKNMTTPDKIQPIRLEVDERGGQPIPIYYEFQHTKFPKGSKVDREGFENPEWEELQFDDVFFGEGTNKWVLKAGYAERSVAIEIFSSLEELDVFLSQYLTGYKYCYYRNFNYTPEHSGSPTLIQGLHPADKTSYRTFDTMVIQKYLEKPQLLEGFKHTVRVHAFYSQENKAYVHPEWYTSICGLKFDVHSNNYITHLSCMDVSDKLPEAIENAHFHCLEQQDVPKTVKISEELNKEIVKMVFDSCIVDGINILNPTGMSGCFEMFGADIIYDANNKPWLLEMNDAPDLYGKIGEESDLVSDRTLDDMLKLTIDRIFPIPADGHRKGRKFTVAGYPDEENLWREVADYSERIAKI